MGLGMGAVQSAVDRSERRGNGEYLPAIYWKDDRKGEGKEWSKIIRFITDDVLTCKLYEFVKGGPTSEDGKQQGRDFIAPGSLVDENGALLFPELDGERDYFIAHGVQLPDYKGNLRDPVKSQKEKTIAIAVVREEVRVEQNGRTVTKYKDKVVKRSWTTQDGEEKSEEGIEFGLVKQGHKNFWSMLVGYYNRWGTICDRDYEIQRLGNGTDTQYVIMPCTPDQSVEDLDTPEKVAAHYEPPVSLKDWAVSKARYAAAEEWLAPNGGKAGGTGQPVTTAPKGDADQQARSEPAQQAGTSGGAAGQSLKDELQGYARTS